MKRHRKHKLIEELKKTPIIELACNNIGISRQTYYRWLDILPNFQAEVEEAMNYGISHINDVCESKVLKKIQNDDWRAIKYWLDHNHPKYMRNKNYNNILDNLYLIKQANKDIPLEKALEMAEDNIKQSVQKGNIKDSKYLLEKKDLTYSQSFIDIRGAQNTNDPRLTKEEIDRRVRAYLKLEMDKDRPLSDESKEELEKFAKESGKKYYWSNRNQDSEEDSKNQDHSNT